MRREPAGLPPIASELLRIQAEVTLSTLLQRGTKPAEKRTHAERSVHRHRFVTVIALIALVLQSGMIFLALFEPPLPYRVPGQPVPDNRAAEFVPTLASITG